MDIQPTNIIEQGTVCSLQMYNPPVGLADMLQFREINFYGS